MSKEAPWIHKVEEVQAASNESLICALITCDGSGEKVKEAALQELLLRTERDMLRKGVLSA